MNILALEINGNHIRNSYWISNNSIKELNCQNEGLKVPSSNCLLIVLPCKEILTTQNKSEDKTIIEFSATLNNQKCFNYLSPKIYFAILKHLFRSNLIYSKIYLGTTILYHTLREGESIRFINGSYSKNNNRIVRTAPCPISNESIQDLWEIFSPSKPISCKPKVKGLISFLIFILHWLQITFSKEKRIKQFLLISSLSFFLICAFYYGSKNHISKLQQSYQVQNQQNQNSLNVNRKNEELKNELCQLGFCGRTVPSSSILKLGVNNKPSGIDLMGHQFRLSQKNNKSIQTCEFRATSNQFDQITKWKDNIYKKNNNLTIHIESILKEGEKISFTLKIVLL